MTAINVVCQPQHGLIQIATDGAVYDDAGVVQRLGSKVHAVPHWSAAIASRGNADHAAIAIGELINAFGSFDELVYSVSRELPVIVEKYKLDRPFELIITGFSSDRRAPEVHFIRTLGENDSGLGVDPYLLFPMGKSTFAPWPTDELLTAAAFVEPRSDDAPKKVARSLRKLLEMQRRVLADDGAPRVGGFAQLTTITPQEISQRIIHRWTEDVVGERMTPPPILWAKWNRENGG